MIFSQGCCWFFFKKRTHPHLNSILTEPGQHSAQLSKLIRLTACKKTKHTVNRWYRTVYIRILIPPTHRGKITSGFSNTITRQRRITTTAVARRSCRTHENCMHAKQIIIVFYIFFYIFCCMYLVLFLILLYRTIVTVYNDNMFLYYYLQQMHQNIHLSLDGVFYHSLR